MSFTSDCIDVGELEGLAYWTKRFKATVALCPPKPSELDKQTLTGVCRASFGT